MHDRFPAEPAMLTYRSLLCPTDFSEHSDAALLRAEDLARRLDAELVLLHVVEPLLMPVEYGLPSSVAVDYGDAATARARQHLDSAAHALRNRGLRVRTLVRQGLASEQIAEVVKSEPIDLVVLATHGYTGLKHALLGSTAERVVRTCPCAVMTVKAAASTASRPAGREQAAAL
jgi:nucleotide-binding universal stress UspA family protein